MRAIIVSVILAIACLGGAPAAPFKQAPYRGAISADASGHVLFADRAEELAYPASVTKLMTAFLVLEDVRLGRYKLGDFVTATADVNFSEASWVGIRPGEKMTVGDMMCALMVESANDVAIALGVHASGSLGEFVARMNRRAKELGMKSTVYYNPNGLPPDTKRRYPWKNFNVSTAADQLKLAVALLKHDDILSFTSVKTCDLVKTSYGYRVSITRQVGKDFRPTQLAAGEKIIKQFTNHNNIMVKDKMKILDEKGRECVDGLKTGFIGAGGSSIVVTGKRKGKRAIVVVLGSDAQLDGKGRVLKKGSAVRDEYARRLLDDALGSFAW